MGAHRPPHQSRHFALRQSVIAIDPSERTAAAGDFSNLGGHEPRAGTDEFSPAVGAGCRVLAHIHHSPPHAPSVLPR